MAGRCIIEPDAGPGDAPLSGHACDNCGTWLHGSHCHSCGAPRVEGRDLSIRRFALEAIQEITSLEHSKLLRTVAALIFRPGFLASEYFSGRRVRYVKPFALALAVLAIHLFAFSVSNSVSMYDVGKFAATQKQLLAGSRADEGALVSTQIEREAAARGVSGPVVEQEVNDDWARNASLMQIPLILLFAFALQLVHIRSRRYFVEHLVFSMYAISFAVLTVVLMWPIYYFLGTSLGTGTAIVAIAKNIVDATWLVLATRTFYRRSLKKSVLLGLLSYVSYYAVFAILHQIALSMAMSAAVSGG